MEAKKASRGDGDGLEVAFGKSRLLGAEDLGGDGGGIAVFGGFRLTQDEALDEHCTDDPVECLGTEIGGLLRAFAKRAHELFRLIGGQFNIRDFPDDFGR